jgi:hypothetical protein
MIYHTEGFVEHSILEYVKMGVVGTVQFTMLGVVCIAILNITGMV